MLIEPSPEEIIKLMKTSDVIVINWWGHPLMVQFVAMLPEILCRLVLYCHINGCVYPYLPFSFLNDFDAVMFTTPYSYENPLWTDIERALIREKSSVVYGMGDFEPASYRGRKSYGCGNTFRAGYIGTLNYAKLSPDFVEYCEAASEKVNNIEFLLAGDLTDEVMRDLEQSSISDKFLYLGYVNRPEEFYQQIDVLGYLLNRYNYATTENVLLEAMACAVPVIAFNHGVERQILDDGYSGYLVENKEEYAERIYELYRSEEQRRRLGTAARQSCMEKYSISRNITIYRQILGRCLMQPKRLHDIDALRGKTPAEWFFLFAQKAESDFDAYAENVFSQESKGSAMQYAKYFHSDTKLKMLCEKIQRRKME